VVTRLLDWIKTHKLSTVLLLFVAYFLVRYFLGVTIMPMQSATLNRQVSPSMTVESMPYGTTDMDMKASAVGSIGFPAPDSYAPTPQITDRLVIQNSYLSLLVENVVETRKKVIDHAVANGGYMVNAETNNPQDAPTGTITIRIPSDKLESTLDTLRGWSIKVVSENLVGTDVTDQYVDVEARIETLEKTKAAMEDILSQATVISDLTNITRELISIQSQIDALKGRQQSLEENAKLAKITIYLSTDEIALPYAPSETFRPQVIFKLAIRSLITHLRALGSMGIWFAVYAVVWVPVLLILYLLNKRFQKRG